jgi:perosamine synthetase
MSARRPKLLVTGGSGLLALNWAACMADRFDVVLVQHRRKVRVAFAQTQSAELVDPSEISALMADHAPDIVVHAAALSNVDQCELDPDQAFRVNADMAGHVAAAARASGARTMHISTDHLSDGQTAMLRETDPVHPLNVYAASKLAGEAAVQAADPDALILRTNFFGWGPAYRSSFSDHILRALRAGRGPALFEDVFFTPILMEDLIETAHALCDHDATGVFNVAGDTRLSKYAFGLQLAETFGLDSRRITATRLADCTDLAKRPLDMSLDTDRLAGVLGRHPAPLAVGLARLRRVEKNHPIKGLGPFMVPYGRHHIDEDDRKAVADFLAKDGWLTQGPTVQAFEHAIADKVGATYAVAVSSATAGLHLAAMAAGLGKGDALLTTPLTFVATANAASYCGARVVFADVNPATANLDPQTVVKALASDPAIKAVSAVHFAGLTCDMATIHKVCRERGVHIIEDAAHALGSQYADGSNVGNCRYSDMTVFSFHPVKAIALGEGGMITTNDAELYRKLLRLRSHGINKLDDSFEHPEESGPWYYEMQELGFNYRITDLQCALGLSQLTKLDRFVDRRRALARRYDRAFANHPTIRPAQAVDKSSSAHHIYVVAVDFAQLGISRTQIMDALRSHGIGTQVHYIPVPMHPYYRKLGASMDALPHAAAYYAHCLTLPLYFELSDTAQDCVIDMLSHLLTPA